MISVDDFFGLSQTSSSETIIRIVDSVDGTPVEAAASITFKGEVYDSPNPKSDHRFFLGYDPGENFEVVLSNSLTHITPVTPFVFARSGSIGVVHQISLLKIQFSGVVVKLDASPVKAPILIAPVLSNLVFCPSDFRCDFEEKVFADESSDGVRNDTTDFLFSKVSTGDTVKIELLKNGVILTEIIDSSLGEYYDGFTSQPLYVGWQADWTQIFNVYSGGRYQVLVTTTILGQESKFESRYFRLNTYDPLSANNTVKIESVQTGLIENSQFDFRGLLDGGWQSSIRLNSSQFGAMSPTLESDNYQDPSYRIIQNVDSIKREYKLIANLVSESIYDRLVTQDLLGNEVFITAYDVLQEISYVKLPVKVESFSDPTYDDLGNCYFEIIFSDRQENIRKVNV